MLSVCNVGWNDWIRKTTLQEGHECSRYHKSSLHQIKTNCGFEMCEKKQSHF
jgi:hypothetical protein